jgi:hypothetical protein
MQAITQEQRAGLVRLAESVRQADGHYVELGPSTAQLRGACRKVAAAAEQAETALATLHQALEELAAAGGGDDRR